MKNPKISIVMGIYNCEEYLAESIDSIINQTYDNWEFIMCDDGSKDNTYKIALQYQDKYPDKIKVLKNEKNMGLNYTLNKCIEHASGEYIARQDGDDVSLPNRFACEMEFLLNNSEYSLVSSNMIFFDENGDWGQSHNLGEVKKENYIKGSPICHAACIIKKSALLAVGGYSVDDKLLRVEDYHLWFKLFIAGYRMYNLEECLYKMRDDANAYKRRTFKNRMNETRLKIWGFRKIKIPFFKRIWAFKPLALAFTPKFIYDKVHRKNIITSKKNDKIKIAQFVGSMNCGGTETMLVNLMKKFDKDKYEIVFIENAEGESWYAEEIRKMGCRIVKVSSFRLKNIRKYISELVTLFKKENFDVVHSHTFLHSGIVMYAAKKAKIKLRIAHSHSAMSNSDNNFLKRILLRKMILKNANKYLACSTEAGISLFGNKFLTSGVVMPNPIQLSKIKAVDTKNVDMLRNFYGISNDELILGHVGRLVEVKNHNFLIDLALKLKKNSIKFKMFFVGDGILKENIKLKIKELHLEDNIIMTGNVNNVYDYMNMFDLLLLPSIYEGLPVTLVESQGCGLKALVSDRVSRESDLGLGLIEFISIDTNDLWLDKIINFDRNYKENIDENKIYETIINKKYDAEASVLEYEKIYKNI